MDGPPQGSSGWQGVSQAEGGGPWGASVTWSNKEGQPVTLEVGWLASKAQAAAARDLLQAWALQEQGQEVTASHLNLDLERYTDVFPTLLGEPHALNHAQARPIGHCLSGEWGDDIQLGGDW